MIKVSDWVGGFSSSTQCFNWQSLLTSHPRFDIGENAEVWGAICWRDIKQPEGEQTTQAGAFEAGISEILQHQNTSKIQILVAHCFARGGKHSDSERQLLGQATLIDNHAFNGFDYVALGHLHRPQRVLDHVWYSGSPLAYSFSEKSEDKGILKVEVNKEHQLS